MAPKSKKKEKWKAKHSQTAHKLIEELKELSDIEEETKKQEKKKKKEKNVKSWRFSLILQILTSARVYNIYSIIDCRWKFLFLS